MFSACGQLLATARETARSGAAIVQIPRAAQKSIRSIIPAVDAALIGELSVWKSGSNGGFQYRSFGGFPFIARNRREYLILLLDDRVSVIVIARPSPDNGEYWQVHLSESHHDNTSFISLLTRAVDRLDEDGMRDQLTEEINKALRSTLQSEGMAVHKVLREFLTGIGRSVEPRVTQTDAELKWLRTLNFIQNSVGWELDGPRLNTVIARAMKKSLGYDYLELQIINLTSQKFETTNSFQHNCTTFGGALLTVILRPDRQEELLRSHKPVIIDENSAGKWLMNPRLMSMMELSSGALIPLIYQRRPNGLLKLFSHRHDHYRSDITGRLDKIGKILAKSLENARMHAMMHRMATMDGLTNVYNHRFFAEQIVREFKRAQRYKSRLSLLMLDIDYFKQYNDNNGHLQGDVVLTTIGKLLKSSVREVDLVCRYGGEEFVVILPETEVGQAGIVAEKIRLTVEEYSFKYEHRQPNGKVTVSIGVAEGVEEIESPTELINRADLALYRAKKQGRNRCEVY